MQSSNPVLKVDAFAIDVPYGERMTLGGTVNKTGILFILLLLSATWIWNGAYGIGDLSAVAPWGWGGLIAGLVLALVTVFKKEWAPYTAPAYALCEGLALGMISAMAETQYPGIVLQAVALTLGVFASMLVAYRTGLIRATQRFRAGVTAAMGGILLVYLVDIGLGFFGSSVGVLHGSGMLGIGVSLVIVAVAALSLVLDFDTIERSVEAGSPRYMEWYGAFGLMVTLVWLYLEILRLLQKSRR